MTRAVWILAIVICVIDIALCAVCMRHYPGNDFLGSVIGFCIFVGAYATQRLRKTAKPGVRA